MIQIIYYRDKCIGCSSCSEIDSFRWIIDDTDGKSNLNGAVLRKNNIWILNTSEDEQFAFEDSADSCPVGIIEVRDL
jgi:ferredoxin